MNGLENWKDRTSKTYKAKKELSDAFDEQRKEMETRILRVCSTNGLLVDSVEGSVDNSVFQVTFSHKSDEIQLSRKFLVEIGMGLSIRRVIDKEANMYLLLELYPFWDEED